MTILGRDIANSKFDLETSLQSHGQRLIWWPHLRADVELICLLFISWQSDHFWLRYSKSHIWPGKFKVKVMTTVKANGHNFLRILSQKGQNDFKDRGQSMTPFSIPTESFAGCMFVQIWWFQLKSVTSYHADQVKFTDRQEQTQAMTIPHRRERPWCN